MGWAFCLCRIRDGELEPEIKGKGGKRRVEWGFKNFLSLEMEFFFSAHGEVIANIFLFLKISLPIPPNTPLTSPSLPTPPSKITYSHLHPQTALTGGGGTGGSEKVGCKRGTPPLPDLLSNRDLFLWEKGRKEFVSRG